MFDLLEFLAQLFVFTVGLGMLVVAVLYVVDRTQTRHAVRRYALAINKEVGVIAPSCGVPEPRRLKRFHCRIVQDDGKSIPFDELYPDQKPRMAFAMGRRLTG